MKLSRLAQRLLVASALAGGFAFPLAAQQQASILSPRALGYLERARLMLADGNFAGTADQISLLLPLESGLTEAERSECRYLLSRAIYERGGEGCVALLKEFVADNPASHQALEARLTIADYYFYSKRWPEALQAYDDIDIDALNPADRRLYTYRKALSMTKVGLYRQARPLFERLGSDAGYEAASVFYLAYLDYVEGNLDSAWTGFGQAAKLTQKAQATRRGFDPRGLDAEYFLTQISFTRGQYREVIERGSRLLGHNDPELNPEIERIVGESWFKLGNEGKAQPYLKAYASAPGVTPAASAVYALGVIDFDEGRYDEAAGRFSQLTEENDAIGQSAYLYLGQCAVRSGDDSGAALAFEKAYRMNFDRDVTETALYNYVAARTRGGNIPFGSSVDMLEDFLERFPDSEYADRVEAYLATAYYNEKDYARALQSIERIQRPSDKVMGAKQKVLYELGMEAVASGRNTQAQRYLQQAIALSRYDRDVAAQAQLWLGDACFGEGSYSKAASAYDAFLKADRKGENRPLAFYDLGYAQYMQNQFAKAAKSFSAALSAAPGLAAPLRHDARIRLADCQYYTGDFRAALKGYTQAVADGAQDADYAAYRRAVMLGLSGDTQGKLRELEALPASHPGSKWIPLSMLEKGLTQASAGQMASAARTFEEVASRFPDVPEARKATLQMALNYGQEGRTEASEKAYKEVISRWPASEEAGLAHEDLRMIYARRGELGSYRAWLASVDGAPQVDDNEAERLTYDAAADAYAADASDVKRLEAYVDRYPQGANVAQALLDIASSRADAENWQGAIEAVDRLLSERPSAPQAPEALLMKAGILEKHIGDSKGALRCWRELERRGGTDFMADSRAGIMRTTSDARERVTYARLVRGAGGLTAEQTQEAAFLEADGLMKSGQTRDAENLLRDLATDTQTEAGARANVALGEMLIEKGDYAGAERLLSSFTEQGTPHAYQLARGYIALADALHGQNKDYLAIEYLKSLRQNYPGKEADIRSMIDQRLKTWK